MTVLKDDFIVGQRWISNAEIDLGLGTVIAKDARTVTLLFTVIGEQRVYAMQHAPLTRVIYSEGDIIFHHDGWQLKVEQLINNNGIITYTGINLTTSDSASIIETWLDSHKAFNKPQDRLYAGQFSKSDHFALRFEARSHIFQRLQKPWQGLSSIRASLIPHQIHIANEISQRHAPRVLLADEVGLGKTIEAGLILHQMLLTGQVERVLIVVPESLQYQWLVEMLRRFNLKFSLFDAERYNETINEAKNPFDTEQTVICSLDFVCGDKKRFKQLTEAKWDILVVDEAHHLEWEPDAPSYEYLCIEKLSEVVPSVLLLTATPEQLGQAGHFARLRLLDKHRFHDYSAFIDEQKTYQGVADAVSSLVSDMKLTDEHQKAIASLIPEEDITDKLVDASNFDTNARADLIEKLLDRHGTSRLLFRNTRQAIKGFPIRQLKPIELELPKQYQTAIKVHGAFNKNQSIKSRVQDLLYPENIYQSVGGEDANWWHFDPRVNWLLGHISKTDEKMLIICAHKTTALQLEQALREREGIRSAVFHEGLSIVERDRAAAYFADEEDGAQVLICSEIGSEGRNFQFAHQMVMFDLPFNPDLLEQRIGRLDRIGQSENITIWVPFLANTAQALLVKWYNDPLDAFEQTCPTGRAIYDKYQIELLEALSEQKIDSDAFISLIAACKKEHQTLKSALEKGRDKLLELNSNGGNKASKLVEELNLDVQAAQLEAFGLQLFELIGLQQDERDEDLWVISPSEHMLVPDFPGIDDDGILVTFQREKALAREDAQFLTWEHPFIRNGLDLILEGDSGTGAMAVLVNKKLPVGTLFVEFIAIAETQAPKSLQLTRFMPPTPVRLLIDSKGNDMSNDVSFNSLQKKLQPVNKKTAAKLIKVVGEQVRDIVKHAESMIDLKLPNMINEAKTHAETALNHELYRLEALSKINKTVRESELVALKENKNLVLKYIDDTTIRIDALRVILVAHE
ncbi:RNA polymerase-associated protein RapA [Thorsellia anophelis]|uniref:RNA polymerase-associated protein RapA n=1 Tax=Thorsellia anophelis DSM 18579 TaxID=1123402 RepID=A0A1I0F102_9GAMM|nr:RNA polymerase-associated protein RapA [Thorsellia anophelis]SET51451.1 ATP-dependent helicase HepA [Thorsellia anophelis DSM 18579]